MTSEEEIIYEELQHNSIVFFKDFIFRLPSNDKLSEDLSNDLIILSVSSLQISFELALKSVLLKNAGLRSLVNTRDSLKTISDLYLDFQNNSLQTKSFEAIKSFVKNNNLINNLTDSDFEYIKDFQRYRNGIIHFSYKFHEGDYFDLKYDITYFIVSILIKVLCCEEEVRPSEFLESSLGETYLKKLINYEPYIETMETMAREHSLDVFTCIICNHDTYAKEEDYCYCCNFDGEVQSFRDCEFCGGKKSMIYDGLNIEYNDYTINAECMKCHRDTIIFLCPVCEVSYNLEMSANSKICSLGHCKDY